MSRSFAVTDSWPHDLRIEDHQIQMVSDEELFVQKLQAVWSTNKKEWSLNQEEGIDFYTILTKNPDDDLIRAELENMLEKLSSTAKIVSFDTIADKSTRHMIIDVKVQDGDKTISVPLEY